MKTVTLKIIADTSSAVSSLGNLKSVGGNLDTTFEKMGGTLTNIGNGFSNMATGLVKTGAGFAPVIAGAGASVKTFTNFDDAMRQVQATMGGTESDYKKLESAAREMGRTTRYTATDAAEALNYLALAGYDTDKAIATLPKVLQLASAGNMDLAKASDLVTDSMSILNIEIEQADDFIDKMAKTSQKSNTTVEQLGEAYLTTGGLINILNGNVDEANVLLGVLADNGFKGAEGGTKLRNVIQSLTSPTSKAAETLDELGVSVEDVEGNMRPMPDILSDLNESLADMGDVEKADTLNKIFNRADISAVNSLLDTSSERYADLANEMLNAEGTAKQMSDTLESGLGGSFRTLKSMIEDLAIEIGQNLAPYIETGIEHFKNFLDAIQPFMPLISKVIGVVALLAGAMLALAPVFIVVGTTFKTLGNILNKVSGLFKILKVVIAVIGGPATLLIASIIAVIAILWIFRDKVTEIFNAVIDFLASIFEPIWQAVTSVWDQLVTFFTEWGTKIWDKISETWTNIVTTLTEFIAPIFAAVVGAFIQIYEALKPVIEFIFNLIVDVWNFIVPIISEAMSFIWDIVVPIWDLIAAAISIVMDIIWTIITTAWDLISTVIGVAMDVIWTILTTAWDFIVTLIGGNLDLILTVITAVWDIIVGVLKLAWDVIITIITVAIAIIVPILEVAWNVIKAVIKFAMDYIVPVIKVAFDVIKTVITVVMNIIKTVITTIWNVIKTVITTVVNVIKTVITTVWNAIKTSITTIMDAIKGVIETVWNAIKTVIEVVVDFILGLFDKWNSLKDTVSNIFNAVKDAIMAPLEAAKDFVDGIVGWISDKLGSLGNIIGKLNPFTNGAFGGRTAMEFSTSETRSLNLAGGEMALGGGIQGFTGGSLGNLGGLPTSTQFRQDNDNSVNIQNLTINAKSQNPKEIEKVLLNLSKRSGK